MAIPYATPNQLELLEKRIKSAAVDPKEIKNIKLDIANMTNTLSNYGGDLAYLDEEVYNLGRQTLSINDTVKQNKQSVDLQIQLLNKQIDSVSPKIYHQPTFYLKGIDDSDPDNLRTVIISFTVGITMSQAEWDAVGDITLSPAAGKLLHYALTNSLYRGVIPVQATVTDKNGTVTYPYLYAGTYYKFDSDTEGIYLISKDTVDIRGAALDRTELVCGVNKLGEFSFDAVSASAACINKVSAFGVLHIEFPK